MKTRILVIVAGVLLFSAIAYAIPTNGMIAYYPFNGNALNESGNGNNGSVHGTTLTTDRLGNVNHAFRSVRFHHINR